MEINLFAGVPVSDYPRSVSWFERFFGRPATFEAHETECVWDVAEHRSVYVVQRPERAGSALLLLFVEDVAAYVEALAARGLDPDADETYDNGVRRLTYLDPDGNEIGVGG